MNNQTKWELIIVIVVCILGAMLIVHHDCIVKQGKQIKQLEQALSTYK
jgi:hypothetical protein